MIKAGLHCVVGLAHRAVNAYVYDEVVVVVGLKSECGGWVIIVGTMTVSKSRAVYVRAFDKV